MSGESSNTFAYVTDKSFVVNDNYVRGQNVQHSAPGTVRSHQGTLDALASVDRGSRDLNSLNSLCGRYLQTFNTGETESPYLVAHEISIEIFQISTAVLGQPRSSLVVRS
jgi:hypothetical protein